ncbi:MAG TPA: hypothetical protein VNT51_14100 [Miltoncostaeaceae bacterium]|nr:hypothetical protein [Miltoncostaeaceae bacterium]
MYARAAVYEDVDLDMVDPLRSWMDGEGLRLSRERLPGYLGSVTLLDRAARRMVGLGLYADRTGAEEADRMMRAAPPDGIPPELREAMRRSVVAVAGVFEVVTSDGVLAAPPAATA